MTKTSPSKRLTQSQCRIGPRDIEILLALDRCPLTVKQMLLLSRTFVTPFVDAHNLRRRLRRLTLAGYVNSWPYAVATDGRSPRYFRLGRDGYRLLSGLDSPMPKRRLFESIAPAHHHHTFCLAEFVVHVLVSAHQAGCTVEQFAGENNVCIKAGSFTLYPDCSFIVRQPDGRTFPFVVEIDNATERVRSKMDVESIERKIRGYDAHQSQFSKFDPHRYLVVFVTTRSQRRLQHILDLAGIVMKQPQRTVFVGTSLESFLASDPFVDPVLKDHRGLKRTLVPQFKDQLKTKRIAKEISKPVVA